MKKKNQKQINLRDKEKMLELMKLLYGNDEVKDDQAHINTKRESGATMAGEVAEHSSTT